MQAADTGILGCAGNRFAGCLIWVEETLVYQRGLKNSDAVDAG